MNNTNINTVAKNFIVSTRKKNLPFYRSPLITAVSRDIYFSLTLISCAAISWGLEQHCLLFVW